MVTLYGIKIVTPVKRLAVGWKPITSTIVFHDYRVDGLDSELLNGFINELAGKRY